MTYQKLKSDDVVEVVAPSYGGEIDLKLIAQAIKDLGLIPRVHSHMLAPGMHPFSANTDEQRFEQLRQAIYAEDSKVIWAFRGGYGTTCLMTKLQKLPCPVQPKILIGYSDITPLHIFFTQQFGWSTIHGRTISEFISRDTSALEINRMKEVLFGTKPTTVFVNLKPLNWFAAQEKTVTSEVIGGCLTLIQTSLGTEWEIKLVNKILLLEDVGERGYNIDRMLTHIKQSGVLDEVKAIIVGDIICKKEENGNELCEEAINRFAQSLNIPVVSCAQIGHGAVNLPVPMNMPATLKLGNTVTLEIDTFS